MEQQKYCAFISYRHLPLDREAAGDVVDTSGLSPRQVAEGIVGLLTVRKES